MVQTDSFCVICKQSDWSVTKHDFPRKDPELMAKWIAALGIDAPKIHTKARVCEKHFARDQYKNNSRLRLKPNAVPSRKLGATEVEPKPRNKIAKIEKPSVSINENGAWWNDKIYLLGHCAICLEPITTPTTSDTEQESTTKSAESIDFTNLWRYLHVPCDRKNEALYNFVRGMNKKGEWTSSRIPPLCSNSCLKNLEVLNAQFKELEQLKLKLDEQTKLVKKTACSIRSKITQSHSSRRNKVQDALKKTTVPFTCISTTTMFFDSLSGPQNNMIPIVPRNPVPIIANSIAILPPPPPTTTASQNQMIVINPNFVLRQHETTTNNNNNLQQQAPIFTCVPSTGTSVPPGVSSAVATTSSSRVATRSSTKTVKEKSKITHSPTNSSFIYKRPKIVTKIEPPVNHHQLPNDPEDDDEVPIDFPDPLASPVKDDAVKLETEEDNDDDYFNITNEDPLA